MELLVLGGTRHVGRSVVTSALARGDTVSALNRGVSGAPDAGVETLTADRFDEDAVRSALGDRTWDAVIDTWSLAPRPVRDSARMLAGRVRHYGYVSSPAAHRFPWPPGMTEESQLVDADPAGEDGDDYAAAKRGGELAVREFFGERALIARAGMVLGPYEEMGRIPWWLRRLERGGRVLAPGPADFPLQYIDGRDLAAWMLSAADRGIGGAFHVTSRPGIVTIRELLETALEVTGSDAELVWAPGELLESEGLWLGIELGMRAPGVDMGSMYTDVSKAYAAGLRIRPLRETLADTWAWLQAEGADSGEGPLASRRPAQDDYIDPDKEQRILRMLA